jgi:hypothetical protein
MKFVNGDKVQFHSTSDAELDSITGKIVGQYAKDAYGAHYIVLLDRQHSTSPWDATCITEHCLKAITADPLEDLPGFSDQTYEEFSKDCDRWK